MRSGDANWRHAGRLYGDLYRRDELGQRAGGIACAGVEPLRRIEEVFEARR